MGFAPGRHIATPCLQGDLPWTLELSLVLLWKATLTQLAQWCCSTAFRTAQVSGQCRRAARVPALWALLSLAPVQRPPLQVYMSPLLCSKPARAERINAPIYIFYRRTAGPSSGEGRLAGRGPGPAGLWGVQPAAGGGRIHAALCAGRRGCLAGRPRCTRVRGSAEQPLSNTTAVSWCLCCVKQACAHACKCYLPVRQHCY